MATIPILKNYPIKINNVAIPFAGSMEENYDTIETVNQSEAGTDIVQVRRLNKLTLSISYTILSDFISQFETWAGTSSYLTVQIFNFGTGAYTSKQMRMRNYKKSLVPKSQDLEATTGIWKVSFELIEK